jgi:hypothetical protein
MNKVAFVTGLWDIGRSDLGEGWSRPFSHYLEKFEQLLKIDLPLIIYGEEDLQEFVFKHRSRENTQFIIRTLDWFKTNSYYDKVQEIRKKEEWYSQSSWLPDSTQARLEMYNPLVMSKMFLLHDAKILNRFMSDHLYWIDAGITNTVHYGYFTHDKVQENLTSFFNKFTFVSFPYDGKVEIHGFEYGEMCKYSGKEVDKVARGGFFGGPVDKISDVNGIYYNLLTESLNKGLMGTEESLFTIMMYRHTDLIDYVEINDNGLIGKFFEDLKNKTIVVKNEGPQISNVKVKDISNTALYVISFNSPNQFETLITSMIKYDSDFITKPKKFLLDNSTDETTFEKYSELCEEFEFEHIKKDNLGICGGRQWIAEHFEETGLEFMYFFEDDMFFYPNEGTICKNGFNRFDKNLYQKSLRIIQKENYDFLKLSFTEFFGDNITQWSWYNVPQSVREEFWPEKNKLPVQGLDPNAPKTLFKNIGSYEGVPYASGEIYYSNWPQVVSKEGNKKMFLTTKWAHPFEQTWMSYMYQETKKGNLKPSILLMSPTEHDRFEHYDRSLRKES